MLDWLGTATTLPGSSLGEQQNAVWLEYAWVDQPHAAAAYDQLAATLRREQLRFVYVHAGVLTPSGTLPPGSALGTAFVQALRQRDPTARIIAWVGQEERAGGGAAAESIDLSNPAVRDELVRTAKQLVVNEGYDGVQYDIEPIVDGNPAFLALLDATRAAIGAQKLLCVAAPMWAPTGWLAASLRFVAGPRHALWSSAYYAAVASRVDQIAVMAYNTALPFGGLYSLVVRVQTQHIVAVIDSAPRAGQIMIGLPTFHDNGFWFHDSAENLTNGIRGVVAGLASSHDRRGFAGIAVYRYGLTSPQDWHAYETAWLGDAQ